MALRKEAITDANAQVKAARERGSHSQAPRYEKGDTHKALLASSPLPAVQGEEHMDRLTAGTGRHFLPRVSRATESLQPLHDVPGNLRIL